MRKHVLLQKCDFFSSAVKYRLRTSPQLRRSSTQPRRWSTPLAKQLFEAINTTGQIPLATYMRMCLTSDRDGYYMSDKNGQDQFGLKGDFITSPEISQIFGELIGIWFVAEWMAQDQKGKAIEFIEVGPGRGTLIDDILRTMRNFKQMSSNIKHIYLVETSSSLREAQKRLLCGDVPMEKKTLTSYGSVSKYMQIPVTWVEHIRFVPSANDKTTFILAHEFFDALPIHAFQSVKCPNVGSQWRELVVTPVQKPSHDSPEFQLSLSKNSTSHSLYLPEISHRYRALKNKTGSIIEISPESHVYAQDFARRIGGTKLAPKALPSGAAIILDYGPHDTIPTNSLRGIREHKHISPFSFPGLVDLSADVDFVALAEAALAASPEVEVHGPVEQGSFLLRMGIKERAEILSRKAGDHEKRVFESAWKRLIYSGRNGMGKVYKAMAIVPRTEGKRKIVGFGGDMN